MEKIYDINDTITYKFRNKNFKHICNGKMILDDTGWLEGYLKSPNSNTKKKGTYLFIFGIYHPNKVLDLYEFNQSSIYPFVFKGEQIDSKYVGILRSFYSKPDEFFTDYTDTLRIKESDSDIAKVKDKIDELKKYIYEEEIEKPDENRLRTNFYNKVYKNRIDLSDILLKANEEITFTEEDRMTARHLNNEKREARHAVKVYKCR